MDSQEMVTLEKDTWAVIREQAVTLMKSGFLSSKIKSPEQAIAIIMTGRELGIGTMTALRSIHVIEGVPTVSPQLMLALVQRTGQVEDLEIALASDGKSAACKIKRTGRKAYTARFGEIEATKLGLSNKDNYKKQPGTMYQWRAVAAACRMTFPDAILGLYTTEEIASGRDTGAGEYIDMEPPPAKAAAPAGIAPTPVQLNPAPAVELEVIENAEVQNAQLSEPAAESVVDLTPEAEEVFEDKAPAATQAQKIRMGELCRRIEQFGTTEAEWRATVQELTNGRTTSRAELTENEATELIAYLAKAVNKLIANKAKN